MKKLFFACLLVAMTALLKAQTFVEGPIHTPTNWTLIGSPYVVTDDISIFKDGSLTIDAGVLVKVDDGVQIEVIGSTLQTNGTATDKVIFMSNNLSPERDSWQGILLTDSAKVNLQFTNFSNAENCITDKSLCNESNVNSVIGNYCNFINNAQGYVGDASGICASFIFTNCIFEDNLWACYSPYDHPNTKNLIDNCNFINNQSAAYIQNGNVFNSTFCGSAFEGLYYADTVINCNFSNNANVAFRAAKKLVQNCIFENNETAIVASNFPQFIGNYIYHNDVGLEIGGVSWTDTTLFFSGNFLCNNVTNILSGNAYNVQIINACFCENDSSAIANQIVDGNDMAGIGEVIFTPYEICDSSVFDGLTEIECSATIDAITTLTKAQIEVYPNPASDFIYLSNLTKPSTIVITDMMGKVVLVSKTNGDAPLQINNLPIGLYNLWTNEGSALFVKI